MSTTEKYDRNTQSNCACMLQHTCFGSCHAWLQSQVDIFEQISIRGTEQDFSIIPVLTCRVYDCMQSGLMAKRVSNLAHRL